MNLKSSICWLANSGLKLSDKQQRRIIASSPQKQSGERPQFLCCAAQNPAPLLRRPATDFIAVQRYRLGIAAVLFDHGPIGSPHHAWRTESVGKAPDLVVRVFVGIFLPRERP